MSYYNDEDNGASRILGTLGLCAGFAVLYGVYWLSSQAWGWVATHWPW